MAQPNNVYDPEADEQPIHHSLPPSEAGQTTAADDASDPRASYNPQKSPMGDSSDPRGDLRKAETGGGLFNPDDSSTGKSISPSALAAAELPAGAAAGQLASSVLGSGPGSGVKSFFWGTKGRRQKTVGSGIIGFVVGSGILLLSILSGPAQLVQLSEILQRDFSGMNSASSSRSNGLLRFSGAADIGETRLGLLGRHYLRGTVSDLSDIGIEFQTNTTGGLRSTTIDTGKLAEQYPELKGMTVDEQQNWLADKFNLSPDQFVKISGLNGNKFGVNLRDFPIRADGALKNSALSLLDDGSVTSAMNDRVLTIYLDLPSLFHPMSLAKATALKKLTTAAERKTAAQEDEASLTEPTEALADGSVSNVEDSNGLLNGIAGKALLFTGGACFMRSTATDIVKINRDRIALPAAIEALNLIAFGEQIKYGSGDVSIEQVGAMDQSLTNSSGQTVWQGQAMQATAGNPNPSGPDIPENYQQAFSNKTTSSTMTSWANGVLGGATIAGVLCSKAGLLAQALASITASVGGIIGEALTGGAATPAEAALVTAKVGLETGISVVGFNFAQGFILNHSTDAKLAKDAFSGPVGGNLLAYGAREGANITARAQGGVALAGSAASTLADQEQQQSQQQFRSESFFARMFDINDYRSLAGKLADSISPSPAQNFATATSSVGNIGSDLLSNISSIFLPKTQAAVTPYNWEFPLDGIPPSLLNDPNLANPYDNADKVATILDGSSGSGYISRALACFGVTISQDSTGVWDAVPHNDVNQTDQSYIDADCANLSDYNWKRVIMFVLDSRTMQAMACYQGDDQSCTEVGFGGGSSPAPTTPTTTSLNVAAASKAAQDANTGGVKVGFALYDSTGKQLGDYNSTTQNYGASITKSMLLVAYLKQVGSGTLSSEAKSELTNMIENSDNASADWVYSNLNQGSSDVNAVASAAGMSGFHFDTSDPVYVLGQSQITADDFAKFFAKIDTLMPAEQKSFGLDLLSHLSSTDQNGLLQAGLPGTVYSKEGWKPESGVDGAPYVVNQAAQFSSGGTTYGVAVTVGGTADQASGEAIVKNVVSALITSN